LVSSYQFFQYFFNLSDELAGSLLSKLTLITEKEYLDVKSRHDQEPFKRLLQNELAKRFLGTFYQEDSYQNALNISQWLFKREYDKLTLANYKMLEEQLPFFTIKLIDYEKSFVETLITLELLASKREANDFIQQQAIKVNNLSLTDLNTSLETINQQNPEIPYVILDIGKKKKYLLKFS